MECTFCFVCLRVLRGSKSQCGGDEVQGVGSGRVRNNNNDRELISIRILTTYLLNTADNKYDSVLKGVLKLAGVSRAVGHDGDVRLEGLQKSPRKCFRLCEKCEGIAGRILELHLELEKVQMKIVQEVKTVREAILRSSGWLGGTGGVQGSMDEQEAFANFTRRLCDADFSTKARGTFAFLKTLQAAVADIDKAAILVPSVYLDKYAITPGNTELLVGGHVTESVKIEPHDGEDEAMEEPWPCQEDSFDVDDGATSDDTFVSSLVSHISSLTHSYVTPAQVPEKNSSGVLGQATERRGKGRPLGVKNRHTKKPKVPKYKPSQSALAVELTGKNRGRPPKARQESFGNTLENSVLLVGSIINVDSWKTAEGDDDDEDTGLQQEDERQRAGLVSLDPEPDSKTACSDLPELTTEETRRVPCVKNRKRGWSHVKKRTSTQTGTRSSQSQTKTHSSLKPNPKPSKNSKTLPGSASNPDSLRVRVRSAPFFKPDDEDEDIESAQEEDADISFSLDEEDSDSSDSISDSDGDYKMPRAKKDRLVQSAKTGSLSGTKYRRQYKRKSSELFYGDDLIDRSKLPKPTPVVGSTPFGRVGRSFKCEACKYKTRPMYTFEQHLRRHETEEKIFNCEQCNQGFSNEQNYRLHEGRHRGHHKLKCAVCRRYFSSFEIADHVKSHFDTVFPCPYCCQCLPSVKLHLAHLQRYHKSVEWKCVVCGEIFQKMTELGDHLHKAHQVLEKINCSYRDCGRTFYDPESLRAHKKIHRMKLGCAQCDKCFSTQVQLDLHQEFHRTGKRYKCDVDNCSEAFPDRAGLRKHNLEIHRIEKQVCEVCGKELGSICSLKAHRITSHGLGGGKPCPVCNRLFPSAQPLRVHMEKFHSTTKNYVCEECGKAFSTMEKCKHHKLIHGERNFQCPHCPRAFHQQPAFKDHLRIHTGEKPYPCRKCGAMFRQCGTRKKHENLCRLSSSSTGGNNAIKTEEKLETEEQAMHPEPMPRFTEVTDPLWEVGLKANINL